MHRPSDADTAQDPVARLATAQRRYADAAAVRDALAPDDPRYGGAVRYLWQCYADVRYWTRRVDLAARVDRRAGLSLRLRRAGHAP